MLLLPQHYLPAVPCLQSAAYQVILAARDSKKYERNLRNPAADAEPCVIECDCGGIPSASGDLETRRIVHVCV